MQVQPYLFFEGRCEEAAAFYREALGAEVTALMYYRDHPGQNDSDACLPANRTDNSVMHMSLRIGETAVMASDGMCGGEPTFAGFALSLTGKDTAEAKRFYEALVADGSIVMPLGETFFSPRFGMVTDKFGVTWMVYVEPEE